jgi:prepilin-type N-terminal cleavage/methylation domain-containing protein
MRRGFTLIEAITTVIVVGIIMVVVWQALSVLVRAAGAVKQKAEASEVAERHLEESIALGTWLNSGDSGVDPPNNDDTLPPTYHWTVTTSDYDEVNMTTDLHLVTCEVTWQARGQEHSLSLSTVMYDGEKPAATTTTQ